MRCLRLRINPALLASGTALWYAEKKSAAEI